MDGQLAGNTVTVQGDPTALRLNQKSHYGNLEGDQLKLSLVEAAYLQGKGKLTIWDGDKEISFNELISILNRRGLYQKFIVYRDLRDRGYIVKTGFKYGSEFRVYERGETPTKDHSSYLIRILHESTNLKILDFSSYVRVAHGVRKKLILAVVDDEEDITYYMVEWIRP
ncbi:tRNA-intron lyase [Methanothermobacter tenebrarum]|uniref:tRNA-splicing endonuclease n=1 Tax=Methanothermobacter tenebrarum TaxID=680118 RepID=A0A328PAV3_9EURY|nr:tRNA-intron lyase [Methanothermobacter tenebrarum]MBC7118239.1 tRNA-intron lyase [Methanobacteriaceae archaeon]NPV64518.1 tRNA-intron lyase [Methanobacteriaceae archaeon]RAO78750.1 tRNA-intron lyase [Methanothermobacter tenebrarum]